MTQETLRTFLAFPISDGLWKKISAVQEELKTFKLDAKWTKPESIHLTLKFLGDTPLASLDEVRKTVEETAKRHSPFSITIDTLGAFPNLKAPRVIWIGSKAESTDGEQLAEDLNEALKRFGFETESRKFKPHLTLARLRSLKNSRRFSEFLEGYTFPEQEILSCQTLIHYKSTLMPHGAFYEVLYQVSLI